MNATRLFLVGEYHLFRECLAAALAEFDHLTVVGQADDLESAREGLAETPADLVLLDVSPAPPGVEESVREFTDESPAVKLIALGLEEDEKEVLRFIEAGSSAYVLKEASVSELAQIIGRVMRGEAVCSPQIASSMFSRLADLARAERRREQIESLNLTPRELEILQLVADGYSNKEIASELFLSFHTVKNHVHNILEKLKVRHRSEAVELAQRRRWLKDRRWRSGEPRRF